MSSDERRLISNSTRRKILGAAGAGATFSLAGCFGGGNDDNGNESNESPAPDTGVDVEVDLSELSEGGTLNVGLRANPSSLDPPFSTAAPNSVVFNLFFESMVTTDRQGNLYPWLAQSYEVEDVQAIAITDYEEYMVEVPLNEDGFAVPDAQVVMEHPDNEAGDDTGMALTVEESGDPVEDDLYGVKINYQLHEGVTFSNGEEMTATNVVRSYERYENSDLSAQIWNNFLHAEAVGDYGVNLYAQLPNAEAERELPVIVFAEEQIDLPNGELDPRDGNDPIGTGPFELTEFEDGERWVAETRDDYWLDDVGLDAFDWWDGVEGDPEFPTGPVIDELNMRVVPETDTRSASLENNEIDLTYRLTADQRTNFDDSDGFIVVTAPGSGFLFSQLPVNVAPFDNEEVRQAYNHLIPREDIVSNIRQDWARPAIVPVPPVVAGTATNGYDDLESDLEQYVEFDADRAEELINEAGVETPIETTLLTNADDDDRVSAVQLVETALNESGLFSVDVETEPTLTDLIGRVQQPEFSEQGIIPFIGLAGTFNPDGYIRVTHHPDNYLQCCHYQDMNFPEINQGLEDALTGTEAVEDPDVRRDLYEDVFETTLQRVGNGFVDYELSTATYNDQEVFGYNMFPFPQSLLAYGLYAPQDAQITYIDRA